MPRVAACQSCCPVNKSTGLMYKTGIMHETAKFLNYGLGKSAFRGRFFVSGALGLELV